MITPSGIKCFNLRTRDLSDLLLPHDVTSISTLSLSTVMAGPSHFVQPVSDADEASLRALAIPANSKAATDWGVRVWNDWAKDRAMSVVDGIVPVTTPLLEIPPLDLVYWFRKFVLEVRKRDGCEYPPKYYIR